jgi:histidyl-tRNA synthetase
VDVFVVDVTDSAESLVLCRELRQAGLRVDRAFDSRSMKSQMKAADRSGAAVAVIVGDEEKAAGRVTVRSLRERGEQVQLDRVRLGETVREMLSDLAGRESSGPRAAGSKP